MDFNHWAEKIRQDDRRALARGLSEIENRGPHAEGLLRALFPFAGGAWRIGVTGPPGSGKSTLVNGLAREQRKQGLRVAIIAVDPTSPFSGGSILGDRLRMQSHYKDPGVFIRSMATRGSLGGLAPATADVMVALEASGREVVLIETVGVGQAEIDIVKMATVVALVLTPSMGDDVQTMKAGVMEIADVFTINKADEPGADRVESDLQAMLSLVAHGDRPAPSIVRTVATEGTGVAELLAALRARPHHQQPSIAYWKERLLEMIRRRLLERAMKNTFSDEELTEAARGVVEQRSNPYEFVDDIIQRASERGIAAARTQETQAGSA